MFRLSDMERFQSSWSLYDISASGFIDTVDLLHLMQHLPEPWGFGGEVKATQYQVSTMVTVIRVRECCLMFLCFSYMSPLSKYSLSILSKRFDSASRHCIYHYTHLAVPSFTTMSSSPSPLQ